MTDLKRAAENVQRFAELFRSVSELADAAKDLGSLEQVTREAQAAKVQAISECDKAEAAHVNLAIKLVNTKASIDEAKAAADEIISKAKAEAQRLIHEGEAKVVEALKGVTGRSDQIEREITFANTLLADLNRDMKAGREELIALEKKLEQVRAKAEAIIRG